MGNQQSCCPQGFDEKQIDKEMNENSVKYAIRIRHMQGNSSSKINKNVFTGTQIKKSFTQKKYQKEDTQSRIGVQQQSEKELNQKSKDLIKEQVQFELKSSSENSKKQSFSKVSNKNEMNPENSNYQTFNLQRSNRTQSKLSSSKFHTSQDQYPIEQQNRQKLNSSQQQALEDTKKTQKLNQTSIIRGSKIQQKQITIQLLPIVKQILALQKPFEYELSLIPEDRVKTLKVNNSKDIYKGQTDYYERPHGFGTLIKENGNVLIGKFVNGSADGPTFYVFSNGSFYKGSMINNKANDAKGIFHSKKLTYRGQFKDNLFNGEGQQLGDNYHFKGIYENGMKKQGTLSWLNSEQHFQSQIQAPSKQNQQKNSYSKSDLGLKKQKFQNDLPPIRQFQKIPSYPHVYTGKFDQNQQFTGHSTLKDPNGKFIGQFVKGKKHGKGQYHYQSQLKYVGDYENNVKSGYGILKNCDDTLAYEGNWKNDLPNGLGCSYDFKGRKCQGQFILGISSKIHPQ